jgi:hypothetical protein
MPTIIVESGSHEASTLFSQTEELCKHLNPGEASIPSTKARITQIQTAEEKNTLRDTRPYFLTIHLSSGSPARSRR